MCRSLNKKNHVMKNIFNSIQLNKPKSNMFDLTHDVKLSMDMGDLVPVCAVECVPGDKFNISAESLIRFAPLIAPVMHRMDAYIHYFFVPNRILWPKWEKWITGEDTTSVHPVIEVPNLEASYMNMRLFDYMGVPRKTGLDYPVNAFPFAAYQSIYQEYYRDQNLIADQPATLGDGFTNNASYYGIVRKRAWEHDYFTSALPFAQKGAAVDIPLGDVRLKTNWDTHVDPTGPNPRFVDDSDISTPGSLEQDGSLGGPGVGIGITQANGGQASAYDPAGTLEVQANSINDLRRAFKLQEWLEKNARAGTRYVENILAHFGVRSSDSRMQRPEYITGVKTPVVVSEVLNTTGESAGLPQGNMAGHAIGVASGKRGRYFCEEHGWIIGIMSVMPKPAYQQGVPKAFIKNNDRFNYYWPAFANIGEQEVLNKEIDVNHVDGDDPFGYVPRYSEYKFMHNRVAGDFRSTLNYWHLGRIFSAPPNLDQGFIECVPSKRIFAVDSQEHSLYVHVLNRINAVRRMPKFGTPQF